MDMHRWDRHQAAEAPGDLSVHCCAQRRMAHLLAQQEPTLFWRLTAELRKHTAAGPAREDVAQRCVVGKDLFRSCLQHCTV